MKQALLSIFLLLAFCHTQTDVTAQCPGALECEKSEIFCSIDELAGFTCHNPNFPNSPFPYATLCFGAGVAHNLHWWGFVGSGGPLTLTFNFDPDNCELGQGIQAGVFEGLCDGSNVWDCNASCNTSTFSLSGSTNKCALYYVWVDGCNGDVCEYTMSATGSGGGPSLQRPLPRPNLIGNPTVCSEVEFCFPGLTDGCNPVIDWSINGAPYTIEHSECISYTIPDSLNDGDAIEVCVRATIGNPANPPVDLCDQAMTCMTFTVTLEEKTGPLIQVPRHKQPFVWNGIPITSSCINPPCSARVTLPNRGCIDTIQPIRLLGRDSTAIVKGRVYLDEDGDCQLDSNEVGKSGVLVTLRGTVYTLQTYSNSLGEYSLKAPLDQYQVFAVNPDNDVHACPDTVLLDVNKPDSMYCIDFFIGPDTCSDVIIEYLPRFARRKLRCDGRDNAIQLLVENTSNQTVYDEMIDISVDQYMILLGADVPFDILQPDLMKITIDSLLAGQILTVTIDFTSDCGPFNTWEPVCFSAQFSDERTCEGKVISTSHCDIIRNSFDPNDLSVTPYGITEHRYISKDDRLKGLIRFHNDGTDTAYDVSVILESMEDMIDVSSFRMINSSAPQTDLTIVSSYFTFDMFDINLPHDDVDTVNSHGFIIYEVDIHPDRQVNETVEQQAFIYFDDNPVVPTNMEIQTIGGEYVRDTNEVELCLGEAYLDSVYLETTSYEDTIITTNPKLILTNNIVVLPSYNESIDTSILAGDSFMGVRITSDTIWMQNYNTAEGCDSTVTYNVDAIPVSTSNIHLDHDVYPNPAQSGLVYFDLKGEKSTHVELVDGLGRQKRVSLEQNGDVFKADLSDLPDGTYLYRIKISEGKMMVGKLIVAH